MFWPRNASSSWARMGWSRPEPRALSLAPRREGWTGNPCYHAALMPCYVRVLEHFELLPAERRKAYEDAVVRYADFTLDMLGGDPVDFDRLGRTFRSEWPSRIVPVIPLVLHAHTVRPDEKYARAARLLFQDLTRLVGRNPHGYFPVWSWEPKAAPWSRPSAMR